MKRIPFLITDTQHNNSLLAILSQVVSDLGLTMVSEKLDGTGYRNTVYKATKPITFTASSPYDLPICPDSQEIKDYEGYFYFDNHDDPALRLTPGMYKSPESYQKGLDKYREKITTIIKEQL